MVASESSAGEQEGRRGKVERVIDQYGLEGLGNELVEHWTADDDARKSLRELAEYINVRLVDAVLQREMQPTVDGEAENYYRVLTNDDVSTASRVDATHRLEASGVDVEQLRSDFVSHQAVHSYLTRDRGESYDVAPSDPEERLEDTISSINRLKNRAAAVTERSIQTLAEADVVDGAGVRASVLVQLECEQCGERYTVREFFDERGCDCEGSAN